MSSQWWCSDVSGVKNQLSLNCSRAPPACRRQMEEESNADTQILSRIDDRSSDHPVIRAVLMSTALLVHVEIQNHLQNHLQKRSIHSLSSHNLILVDELPGQALESTSSDSASGRPSLLCSTPSNSRPLSLLIPPHETRQSALLSRRPNSSSSPLLHPKPETRLAPLDPPLDLRSRLLA
ncbi:hypothetical protein N431DRAFT_506709 [Stipitochalara longipes BDJ]|nr:hypothetical protein N431DRAFT_506709 [Stipitochalara longipes BDJ]